MKDPSIADFDPLLGLMPRGDFLTAASRLSGNAGGSVLYIDIDRFSHVNLALDFGDGDRYLQSIASLIDARLWDLPSTARTLATRFGSDEFAVFISDTDLALPLAEGLVRDAKALAAPLEAAVRASPHGWREKTPTTIGTLAIGVADVVAVTLESAVLAAQETALSHQYTVGGCVARATKIGNR